MAGAAGRPEELLRHELAGRQLLARTLLVLGVCAGTGMVFGGIHDRVRNTATSPSMALGSLLAGILVTLAGLALTALLALRSRERIRLLSGHGPEGLAAVPPLRGSRAAWRTVSSLGLALGALCLVSGLLEAFKDDPYEDADPFVYGALLLWTVVLGAAGVAGIVKARRFPHPGPGTAASPPGAAPGAGAANGVDLGKGGGARSGRAPAAPAVPSVPPLYSRFGRVPFAPHRLSPRLAARVDRLSRGAAVALALLATLAGCGLAAATALLPVHLGGGAFWLLMLLTAGYLLALLMELVHYGPRRRYAVLFAGVGVGLLVAAGNGFTTVTLLERGAWVDTTVVDVRNPSKGGPTCELRPEWPDGRDGPDGREATLSKRLPCRGLETGDAVRVFHDPKGEASPRRSQPHGLGGLTVAWSLLTSCALGLALMAALYGHRRRRELSLGRDREGALS